MCRDYVSVNFAPILRRVPSVGRNLALIFLSAADWMTSDDPEVRKALKEGVFY